MLGPNTYAYFFPSRLEETVTFPAMTNPSSTSPSTITLESMEETGLTLPSVGMGTQDEPPEDSAAETLPQPINGCCSSPLRYRTILLPLIPERLASESCATSLTLLPSIKRNNLPQTYW